MRAGLLHTGKTKMTDITVLKLSGKALGGEAELASVFKAARGHKLVVVHGGGVEVDALFQDLKLKVEKVDGLRVSPKEQMPYISAALSGMCGKRLQGLALKSGLNAVSLLCTDGGSLKVRKLRDDLGMVGTVEPLDGGFLLTLLDKGITPIICSVAQDPEGQLYNVNADDAAVGLAQVLNAPLYLISDVPGVLDKEKNLIPALNKEKCEALIKDGTISGGMTVKVKGALRAAADIGQNVCIASFKDPNLAANLFAHRRLGTSFAQN